MYVGVREVVMCRMLPVGAARSLVLTLMMMMIMMMIGLEWWCEVASGCGSALGCGRTG
jgi:hypothetical protein